VKTYILSKNYREDQNHLARLQHQRKIALRPCDREVGRMFREAAITHLEETFG
jgi:hypothetical protein